MLTRAPHRCAWKLAALLLVLTAAHASDYPPPLPDPLPELPPSPWSATVGDETLHVRKDDKEVCTVPLRVPPRALPNGGAEATVRADGRYAAVATHTVPVRGISLLSVLVVDVPTCRPVAIASAPIDDRGDGRVELPLRFEGDTLVHYRETGAVRWNLRGTPQRLLPWPDQGFDFVAEVLDAGVPAAIQGHQLFRFDGSAPLALGREYIVAGDEIVTMDDDGWRRLSVSGAVLASGPDLPLSGLTLAVRTADALYVSDRFSWFDLTHRRSVVAPLADRLASFSEAGRRFTVEYVPDGARVVGEGAALGPVMPGRPEASVSPDGRVLVYPGPTGLVAREVAGGSELWRAASQAFTVEATGRWATGVGLPYLRSRGGYPVYPTTLLDPANGTPFATIATVPHGSPSLVPVDPSRDLTSLAWNAAVPARTPWHASTLSQLYSAQAELVQALACGRDPGNLASLAQLVPAVDPAVCRSVLHPERITAEEATRLGVAWGWSFEGWAGDAEPLGDDVLVHTNWGIAAFRPDGTLRWTHGGAGSVAGTLLGLGPVVVQAANGRATLLSGATGAERWSTPAAAVVGIEGDRVWINRLASSPPSAISLATGKAIPGALRAETTLGWRCGERGCARTDDPDDAPAPDPVPPSLPSGWRLERGKLLGPPGPAAPLPAPLVPAWTAASARFPVAGGPALAVITKGGVVVLGADGHPRWRAAGKDDGPLDPPGRLLGQKRIRADGWDDASCCVAPTDNSAKQHGGYGPGPDRTRAFAGEIEAIAESTGTTGRRWADGVKVWSRGDLVGGNLFPIGGALKWVSDRWELLDPRTGATIAKGEHPLLAVSSGPGPLRVAVWRGEGGTSILDAAGTEVRVVTGVVTDLVSDSRGLTWVENNPSTRGRSTILLVCSDTGSGWCVPGWRQEGGIASDGERIYVGLEHLVVAIGGDGEVAWAAPVENARAMFLVE